MIPAARNNDPPQSAPRSHPVQSRDLVRRLRPYFRLLRPVWAAFAGSLAAALVFGVATGFGIPFMTQKVFPRIFSSGSEPVALGSLFLIASILPAVFFLRGISGYLNVYLINYCGVKVLEQLREKLFNHIQFLPLSYFHRQKSGDLISRIMADTTLLQTTLTTVANDIFKQPVTFLSALGSLIYLAVVNDGIVYILLCLGIIPATVFPIRYFGRRLQLRAAQAQAGMGSLTDILSQNLGALQEVRAFGMEEREKLRFRERLQLLLNRQLKVVKYNHALSPTIEFLAAFGLALSFVIAYQTGLQLETFLAIFTALFFSYEPIKKMGMIHNELSKGLGALDRIEAILDEPITITDPLEPVKIDRSVGKLSFQNVTFAYQHDPVLTDVSVEIPANSVTALVGPSGAGKTTFANLVPRFYDPINGSVLLDGTNLRKYRLSDLRRQISLVSQDPVLFATTIYENILVSCPEATAEEVRMAAGRAFAHEFIETLPQQYETLVGERGVTLSGGQKQRLALARAFLRQAPILILDEATSALDAESEEKIQMALRQLLAGKTVLIIAHRFSTIRDADRVLVFEAGRIVDSGQHDELIARCSLYRTLYERQIFTGK